MRLIGVRVSHIFIFSSILCNLVTYDEIARLIHRTFCGNAYSYIDSANCASECSLVEPARKSKMTTSNKQSMKR